MTIGLAIAALRDGRVVSRTSWAPGTWLTFTSRLVMRCPDGIDRAWTASDEDLFAEDWQLGQAGVPT